jgi:hypothetical protein
MDYKRRFDAKLNALVASANPAASDTDVAMDFMYGLDNSRYAEFKAEVVNDMQNVSIRTYSEHLQRSTQEPKRDPSVPEGTARTPQATDSQAYTAKRYTVIEYCATHYAT